MSRKSLRSRIVERAHDRCEYCQAPQNTCGYSFHLEHIIPITLGGADDLSNRALACPSCNLAKSDRVSGQDPLTKDEVPLYNPRDHHWRDHFTCDVNSGTLHGKTVTGRATVAALDMNSTLRVEARQLWFAVGLLP